MARLTMAMALLFLVGCAPKVVYKYKEVKVPVHTPVEQKDPVTFELPVKEINELTVRSLVEAKEYGEIVYRLGSSLILLNGDVKAYREVLGACQ